jgi:hypothetical protein
LRDPANEPSGDRHIPSAVEILARFGKSGPGPLDDTIRQWLQERYANQAGSPSVPPEPDLATPMADSDNPALRELDRRLEALQVQLAEIVERSSRDAQSPKTVD